MDRDNMATPITGTASVKVEVDSNGNLIASSSQTSAGTKRVSINNIFAGDVSGNLLGSTEMLEVFTAFYVTLSGVQASTFDQDSLTYTTKWEIAA